jgi:mono/diheme cytochrome c family protein
LPWALRRGGDTEMQTIAGRMSADEIAAVAAYLSTLD